MIKHWGTININGPEKSDDGIKIPETKTKNQSPSIQLVAVMHLIDDKTRGKGRHVPQFYYNPYTNIVFSVQICPDTPSYGEHILSRQLCSGLTMFGQTHHHHCTFPLPQQY